MGDYYRVVVDPRASAAEAPVLAKKVIEYMVRRNILRAERSACVCSDEGGYPPGDNVAEALAQCTSKASKVPLPLEKIVAYVRQCAVNGVVEVVGRTVFHNGGLGVDVVRCPLCQANDVEGNWGDAVGHWYYGDDLAPLQCSKCNEKSPLSDWTFDPPWAFGHLGFQFWNWSPMKRDFIDRISDILGHKVVLVTAKV